MNILSINEWKDLQTNVNEGIDKIKVETLALIDKYSDAYDDMKTGNLPENEFLKIKMDVINKLFNLKVANQVGKFYTLRELIQIHGKNIGGLIYQFTNNYANYIK